MTNNINHLIVIGIFSFLGLKPTSMQVLFHFFMTLTRFFEPNNAFLHICLSKFSKHTIQVSKKKIMQLWHINMLWKKHDQNKFPESFPSNLKFHI